MFIASIGVVLICLFLFKIDNSEQDKIKTEQTKAVYILQDEFFGSKKIEIAIRMKEPGFWSTEKLNTISEMENEIAGIFDPRFVNSPTLIAKRYHRYIRNGHPAAFTIQKTYSEKTVKEIESILSNLSGSGILAQDKKTAKIVKSINILLIVNISNGLM